MMLNHAFRRWMARAGDDEMPVAVILKPRFCQDTMTSIDS